MKLQFRTLHKTSFEIEIDEKESVKALKEKVKESQGCGVAEQKIIYSGKILNDDSPLTEYQIKESAFLVLMTTKPKAAPAKPTPAPATAGSSTATTASGDNANSDNNKTKEKEEDKQKKGEEEEEKKTEKESGGSATAAAPAESTTAATSAAAPAASSEGNSLDELLARPENAAALNQCIEMGFPREEAINALRAAFFNPDRAVEYLMTGIPETAAAEMMEEGGDEMMDGAGQQQMGSAGAGAGGSQLQFLLQSPEFHQMRQLVRSNPQYLPTLLQQLGNANPELLQLISENQEEFMMLINGDMPAGMGGAAGEGEEGAAGAGGVPQDGMLRVTPQEKEAIDRLCALGFDQSLVVQAYFACDKNEELAANFLFENGDGGN